MSVLVNLKTKHLECLRNIIIIDIFNVFMFVLCIAQYYLILFDILVINEK